MPHEDYRVHEVPWDLDGDGKPEHQVLRGCGATGNCDRLLYLTGAGCAHYAGILAGSLMIRLPAKSHGLPDLATYWVNGCGGQEGVATHLSFDGATYRAITTTQCPCGDQPDAGPRPASCPPWE